MSDPQPSAADAEPRIHAALVRGDADLRFLAEAGARLMASLESDVTLEAVLRLAVPRLADWCFIDLLEPDGKTFRRLAVAHAPAAADNGRGHADEAEDARRADLARRLQRCCPPVREAAHGVGRVIRTGRPEWYQEPPATLTAALASVDDDRAVIRELDIHSYVCVPLAARGRVLGALTCILAESGRHYDEDDVALATALAERAAVAVDNAELHQEALAATRARDEVLAVVSHDLKNPLATVAMAADFLLQELVPDVPERATERRQLAVIRRAADRGTRLIRDLLDAARAEAGKLPVEPAPATPASLVREALETLTPQAAERNVRLVDSVDGTLPEVCADRDRTLQVLTNLVGNAVKFTPAGGEVRVRAGMAPGVSPPAVCFAVRDTGLGLAPEEIAHIFDRYWQARKTAKLGTGLGLVIAKGIVEAQRGRIWAESDGPGRGSTFAFTLPAVTRPPATPPAERSPAGPRHAEHA